MRVYQAREDKLSVGFKNLGACRVGRLPLVSDGLNLISLNDDQSIRNGLATVSVNEGSPLDHQSGRLLSLRGDIHLYSPER